MSDRIRTALEGSGTINIKIEVTHDNDVQLCVVESWARLTGIQRSEIKSHILDAADDPDKFIADEVTHLFNKHMNWKAAEPPKAEEPPVEAAVDPMQDAITEMMKSSVYKPRPLPPLVKPAVCERPKPSPTEELVKSIQAGTTVRLQPTRFEQGKKCGVCVTVEGINPTFSSLRTLRKELSHEQLTEAANPYGLVQYTVLDLSQKICGPI